MDGPPLPVPFEVEGHPRRLPRALQREARNRDGGWLKLKEPLDSGPLRVGLQGRLPGYGTLEVDPLARERLPDRSRQLVRGELSPDGAVEGYAFLGLLEAPADLRLHPGDREVEPLQPNRARGDIVPARHGESGVGELHRLAALPLPADLPGFEADLDVHRLVAPSGQCEMEVSPADEVHRQRRQSPLEVLGDGRLLPVELFQAEADRAQQCLPRRRRCSFGQRERPFQLHLRPIVRVGDGEGDPESERPTEALEAAREVDVAEDKTRAGVGIQQGDGTLAHRRLSHQQAQGGGGQCHR